MGFPSKGCKPGAGQGMFAGKGAAVNPPVRAAYGCSSTPCPAPQAMSAAWTDACIKIMDFDGGSTAYLPPDAAGSRFRHDCVHLFRWGLNCCLPACASATAALWQAAASPWLQTLGWPCEWQGAHVLRSSARSQPAAHPALAGRVRLVGATEIAMLLLR